MHPELYRKNAIFGPNLPPLPKFQSNKDRFTKLWIAICKSLSKYEIMQKIFTKYFVDPELYTKNAIFGPNLPHLLNFWRLVYFFQKTFNSPNFFPEFVSASQKLAYFIIVLDI